MTRLFNSQGAQIEVPEAASVAYIERGWTIAGTPAAAKAPAKGTRRRSRSAERPSESSTEGHPNAVPPRPDR